MPKPLHTTIDTSSRIDVSSRIQARKQDGADAHDALLHESAVLCARLARLLTATLSCLDWQALRFADRSRLARTLARLTSDARLAALTAGGRKKSKATPESEAEPVLPCSPE